MIEALIRHKHVTIVAVLILCLLGISAALKIPVQMIPDLEVRTISVQTNWPGATPQDIEKEILIEQEEYLRTVPNLQRMESSASNGLASIELDFPFGIDVTETLILVNNALSQVPNYPDNVDQPRIFAASFSSNAFMYFRVAPLPDNPKNIDMVRMRDYIEDNVRPRMSSVAGVSQVEVSGGAQRQVRIQLDREMLSSYGLTVTDVQQALQRRNVDTSAGEEAKTFASMNAPPGYNLQTMSAIGDEIRAIFDPALITDRNEVQSPGGLTIPALKTISYSISPTSMRIIAETRNPDRIEELMDAITTVYERYPGMRAFATKGSIISSNDGGTRSINVDVGGSNLAEVYNAARAIYARSEKVFGNPRIQSNPSSLTLQQPLLEVKPDFDRLAEINSDAESLGFAVAALTDGAFVGEFFQGDDKIDMYLFSQDETNVKPDDLNTMPVLQYQGRPLPLSALAEVKETVDTSTVRRVDSRRTVTLNIIPPDDVPLESGVQTVQSDVIQHLRDQGVISKDITTQLSGAADQLAETQAALSQNYLLSVAIVYLLMVAIFAHWGYPLLIMLTIPMGISAGILGLALMNGVGDLLPLLGMKPLSQPFDMITMLGFLILMGTVINNPILVVERAVYLRDKENYALIDAIKEGLRSRVRPITITTLTTLCGIAPLVFIPGEGTELYRGVGIIVMFGLIGAAIVTIVTLPALSALLLKEQRNAKTE